MVLDERIMSPFIFVLESHLVFPMIIWLHTFRTRLQKSDTLKQRLTLFFFPIVLSASLVAYSPFREVPWLRL